MSFLDVKNPELSELGFSEDGEMVVGWEVTTLDVVLIEDVSWGNQVGPNFFNVCILKLVMPMVVMLGDLAGEETPVALDVSIDFNHLEAHLLTDKLYL